LGGVTVDVMGTWKFLLVTSAEVIAAFAVISLPFHLELTYMWFMFLLTGVASGLINVGKLIDLLID